MGHNTALNIMKKNSITYILLTAIVCPIIVGYVLYKDSSNGNNVEQEMMNSPASIQAGRDVTVENFNVNIENKVQNKELKSKKRISSLTRVEIYEAMDNAPPLQREEIGKNYENIRVSWDAYYSGAYKQDKNMVYILVRVQGSGRRSHQVSFYVLLDDYPELAVLKENAKIKVTGDIIRVDDFDTVELTDIELAFYKNNEIEIPKQKAQVEPVIPQKE